MSFKHSLPGISEMCQLVGDGSWDVQELMLAWLKLRYGHEKMTVQSCQAVLELDGPFKALVWHLVGRGSLWMGVDHKIRRSTPR